MKQKTVLILGIGQTNFINPIYKAVKEKIGNITFSINKLRDINNSGADLYSYKHIKKNNLGYRFIYFCKIFNLFHFKLLFIRMIESGLFPTYRLFKLIVRSNIEFFKYESYNYYHVHFVSLRNLLIIPYINENKSILILSFWGSDLLRKSSLVNNFITSYACRKAKMITIQSLELREILLAKFDRNLISKIRIQKFILDDKIFKYIDNCKDFEENLWVEKNKINILVGHNANPDNQHLKIIKSLNSLNNQEDYNLIFVFGYGINNNDFKKYYKDHILSFLQKTNFSYKFIDDFLPPEKIAFLRKYVEITIHTPVSDALSAAITESMYAGNIVIAGAWLPYGPFRRAGCKFLEIENFNDLSNLIECFHEIFNEDKANLMKNRQLVRSEFLSEKIDNKWVELFK